MRFFSFEDMEDIRRQSSELVETSQHLQSECMRLRIESQEIKNFRRNIVDQLANSDNEIPSA